MAEKELPRTVSKVLQRMREGTQALPVAGAPVRIVSHYDADGLCAGGILCCALQRKGIPFHCTIVHSVEAGSLAPPNAASYPAVIFSDLGSAALDQLEPLDTRVVIIDHHQAQRESRKVVQLNCHLWGIDGAFEACASTLALLFAVALDERNWDLAGLAVAGALGDRQHLTGWKGLNAEVLSTAERLGEIRTRKGLVLEGEDLGRALSDNNEPFFRGLSGDPKASAELIEAAGLSPAATLKELGEVEMASLASLLVLHLLKQGVSEEHAGAVLVDRYWSRGRDADAGELSAVINACGRLGQEDLGLEVCLGGAGALARARELRRKYRELILKGMLELQERGLQKKPHLQYFYSDSAQMAGAFAALVMNFLHPAGVPTVSLAREGPSIKVSARGTRALVSKGLDLARACRRAAQSCGGEGGGHSIASGATVPLGAEVKFLDALDAEVGQQLAGGGR